MSTLDSTTLAGAFGSADEFLARPTVVYAASDLARLAGRVAGLVAFGALLYSYCHLLAQAAAQGMS